MARPLLLAGVATSSYDHKLPPTCFLAPAMLCTQRQQQLCNCSAFQRHYRRTQPRRHTSRAHQQHCQALPAAAAASLALAFLPWSGCSQGGFYATGVEGTHGKDCQGIYQPAAAAEERLAAQLQLQRQHQHQQQQQGQQVPNQQVATAVISQAPDPVNSSTSSSSAAADGQLQQQQQQELRQQLGGLEQQQQQQQQLTASEQLQQVPDAAKDLVRNIMHEDNRQRTKQLVDDAWQTLE